MKVGNTTKESDAHSGSWRRNIFKNVTIIEEENTPLKPHVDDSIKLLPKKSVRSKFLNSFLKVFFSLKVKLFGLRV